MKKEINIRSRYGDIHKLIRINKFKNKYLYEIRTNSYLRIIFNNDNIINLVDLDGGPCLSCGDYISEADAIIEDIFEYNNKICIVFRK